MPFSLSIVTPQGAAFEGRVDTVVLPGSEGDFGVLADHERFLCPLRIGKVEIQQDGQTTFAAVSGGFADVGGDRVAVLVDSCELSGNIDLARAELALQHAERDLAAGAGGEGDRRSDFEAAVERARNRISIGKGS